MIENGQNWSVKETKGAWSVEVKITSKRITFSLEHETGRGLYFSTGLHSAIKIMSTRTDFPPTRLLKSFYAGLEATSAKKYLQN